MSDRKGTTKSQGNKHVLDKFYTKDEIVDECLKHLELSSYDCIIEPSAGNGSFSNKIVDVKAYDIQPENDSISEADWLKFDKSLFQGFKNILVVGNPPFGSQGTVAFKFMVESMKFADTIAFILPKGFKKISMKNRLPLNFHLTTEFDLPLKSFLLEGEDYSVPCVFQIWQKSDKLRTKIINKTTTSLFQFVKPDEADFKIQRVGGSAGKSSLNLNASVEVNYFLKNTSNMSTENLMKTINETTFPTIYDTTGPRSLSKGELIACLEQKLLIENM